MDKKKTAFWTLLSLVAISAVVTLIRSGSDTTAIVQTDASENHAQSAANSGRENNTQPELATESGASDTETTAEAVASPEQFSPFDTYNKYLIRALDGDAASQYALHKIANYCRGMENIESSLRRAVDMGLDESVTDLMTQTYERCKSLVENVSNLETEDEKWYVRANESNYPLIGIMKTRFTDEEQRARIRLALREALKFDEKFLRQDAYMAASHYYSRQENQRETKIAWALIYCAANPRCDSDEINEIFRNEVPVYVFEQALEGKDQLEEELASGHPDNLGFLP